MIPLEKHLQCEKSLGLAGESTKKCGNMKSGERIASHVHFSRNVSFDNNYHPYQLYCNYADVTQLQSTLQTQTRELEKANKVLTHPSALLDILFTDITDDFFCPLQTIQRSKKARVRTCV